MKGWIEAHHFASFPGSDGRKLTFPLYSAFDSALFDNATPLDVQHPLAVRFLEALASGPLDFFKDAGFQRVKSGQGAANDLFGRQVNPVRDVIHLRVLRALRFHCLT